MQTVNIAELKNNLSAYLDYVRTGNELPVKDQHRFIVKLVPLTLDDEHIDAEELELAMAGLVRLPEAPLPESFWEMPAPSVSDEDAIAAVRAERDED